MSDRFLSFKNLTVTRILLAISFLGFTFGATTDSFSATMVGVTFGISATMVYVAEQYFKFQWLKIEQQQGIPESSEEKVKK